MKIFVGSSSKKKRKAAQVAKALKNAGFDVFRWWDPSVFKGGEITIGSLIEVKDICDGAVLIFGADDKVTIENSDGVISEINAPRDYVILEFVLFVCKNGVDKTLFVTEPGVKIPSDLKGVNYLGEPGYLKKIVDSFKEAFKLSPKKQSASRITFHLNRKLINLLADGGDKNWISRSLYLGRAGAHYWNAVENDPAYSGTTEFAAVQQKIIKLASDNDLPDFDCIVSFGPGVGRLDTQVVPYLRGKLQVKYIPIDINLYLANFAAEAVSDNAKYIHTPFCIVGDFEQGMGSIAETVHAHTTPGRVFMMLGGTFGNLEQSEDTFLQGLMDIMDSEDIAILDVFTAESGYMFSNDQLLPITSQPSSVQEYLANGVQTHTKNTIEDIVDDIDDFIEARPLPKDSHSSVNDTHAFAFYCKLKNRPIIYVRRYNFDSFLEHLDDFGFDVFAKDLVPGGRKHQVGRGIFFLRRKN